jgi:hypothetical protein
MKLIDQLRNDASIRPALKAAKQAVRLLGEKLAGHLEDPARYPLPADPQSAERALYNILSLLPDRRRRRFKERFKEALKYSAAQRQQAYGDLAVINLRSAEPIASQLEKISHSHARPLSSSDQERLHRMFKQQAVKPKSRARSAVVKKTVQPLQSVPPRVQFFADTLTCIKKSEIGKDEINMAAFAIDALGVLQNKDSFFVGKFKKGDSLALPGSGTPLFEMVADGGSAAEFPLTFAATLFLIEEDIIHNTELADKLTFFFTILSVLVMAAVGVVIVIGMAGGPVSASLAYLLTSIAMGCLVLSLQLLPLLADDISTEGTDLLVLDAAPVANESISRSVTMALQNLTGDLTIGEYRADLRWEIVV